MPSIVFTFSQRGCDCFVFVYLFGRSGLSSSWTSGRIEQALANLVDNALRHGASPVRLSARGGLEEVELHVTDSGAGFEPGFLEHAFERFTQADPGGLTAIAKTEGTKFSHTGTSKNSLGTYRYKLAGQFTKSTSFEGSLSATTSIDIGTGEKVACTTGPVTFTLFHFNR